VTRIASWLAWMIVAAVGLALPEPRGETLDQRRARVEQMPEPDKAELSRRFHEFSAMPAEQRVALRQLHDQIESDADRSHLLAVMDRYCRWYESLPPFRKAELLGLKPEDRVKRIKGILEEQAKWEAARPSPQDALGLARWFDSYLTRHEAEILKTMPDWFRHRLDGANAGLRKRMLMGGHAVNLGKLPQPDASELNRLRQSLSAEARARLQPLPAAEQWQMVLGWVRQAAVRQALGGGGKGGMRLADEQELSRFFEEGLTEEQRDRVLGMPAELMQYELLRLYLGQHGKGPEPAGRHGERGQGKWPGLEGFPPRRKPPAERGGMPPSGPKRPRGEDEGRKRAETREDL